MEGGFGGALAYAKSPGSFCFTGGTLILTIYGYKLIEDIRIGDKVLSTDPETGETSEKTVLQTFERETTEFVDVTIDGETYTTTPEHPFYVEGKDFVNASELEVGDKVVCCDTETDTTETKEVEEVHCYETDEPVSVYNFEVHENHTYHVGEDGVLVHNSCKNPGKANSGGSSSSGGMASNGGSSSSIGNGKQYSVMYEANIGGGKSRSAHRNAANKQFYSQMKADSEFKGIVDDYFGYDVMEHMNSGKGRLKNPSSDWVWHHSAESPNVIQLIPKNQHQNSVLQSILHPGPKGEGGFGLYY